MPSVNKIYGVGVNDAAPKKGFPVTKTWAYRLWVSMLARCYGGATPGYSDCSVDPRWHYFSSFNRWVTAHGAQGKQLDKDIKVPGNRVYGPDTCLFVPRDINTLIKPTTRDKPSGLPLGVGVDKNTGLYYAHACRRQSNSRITGLATEADAHVVYLLSKSGAVQSAANNSSGELKEALLNWVDIYRTTARNVMAGDIEGRINE